MAQVTPPPVNPSAPLVGKRAPLVPKWSPWPQVPCGQMNFSLGWPKVAPLVGSFATQAVVHDLKAKMNHTPNGRSVPWMVELLLLSNFQTLHVYLMACDHTFTVGLLLFTTLRCSKSAPSPEPLCCLWTGFPKPDIRRWPAVCSNSKPNPVKVEEDLTAPLNPACKMLLLVHVCQWTSAMWETHAASMPYLPLSSISTLHTQESPRMQRGEVWSEIRWWVGG